ncbi:MAG: hypothetical protein AAGA56_15975, partial [Myxococcota bacterium]
CRLFRAGHYLNTKLMALPTPRGSASSTDPPSAPQPTTAAARLRDKLQEALKALGKAPDFARSKYQDEVFQIAEALMGLPDGVDVLSQLAPEFEPSGVFAGGPWADPAKLQPVLVRGSLQGSGVYPVVETLSELRVMAIAEGRYASETMTTSEALAFLEEVVALNLHLVFPGHTEQERVEGGPQLESNQRLFRLIAQRVDVNNLQRKVVAEIVQVAAQRPVHPGRLRQMVDTALRMPPSDDEETRLTLATFGDAVHAPAPLSQALPDLKAYRRELANQATDSLEVEAEAMAAAMKRTGLCSRHHAVLLRHLAVNEPILVGTAMGLDTVGLGELEKQQELVRQLIKVAVRPATAHCIYGLSRLIERGLLSRREVAAGLNRVFELDLTREVRRTLHARRSKRDGVTANALLLADVIAVLGQPLGIGQGNHPTCQAARGLSLWSQHAPGYLLELMISAARDGLVEIAFEGQSIRTDQLLGNREPLGDPDLDAVSVVLIPHLDRIYEHMMRQVALRPDDGHKWVNPALYGRWVPNGFASAFRDVGQTTVVEFEDFVRRLYATHHPAYNDGHHLMYPNPVGLCVTNNHGVYLGPHAISLQRVAEDSSGALRAYFYNPNNEGRQDWGNGIRPAVDGHGELQGESSLPFHEFASRIYAFHYNPYEEGDGFAVPDQEVEQICQEAKASWGRAFTWRD